MVDSVLKNVLGRNCMYNLVSICVVGSKRGGHSEALLTQ